MKNFHLPLPEQTYIGLRAEAERTGVPATTLAREAVDCWVNIIVNRVIAQRGFELDMTEN